MPNVYELGLDKRAGHWRIEAAKIIMEVLRANQGKSVPEIRKALHAAYPYGERKYHPYKVWLDEIARQMGRNQRFKARVPGRRQLMSLDPDPAQDTMDFKQSDDAP